MLKFVEASELQMSNLLFLTDFMAKTGQTKADIARRVGVSNAAVSDWFKRDDLRFSTALRILGSYKCDIKFTLHKNEEPTMMYFSFMNTINISALDFENKNLTSLKQAIKASGWTMKRIADGLGVAPETLTYYWNTDDCPISTFYKVAKLIDYSVSYSIDQQSL